MNQTKTVSVDQIAYESLCSVVGKLQGQIHLLNAQLQFERQEKEKALNQLEELRAKEEKPEKEGE